MTHVDQSIDPSIEPSSVIWHMWISLYIRLVPMPVPSALHLRTSWLGAFREHHDSELFENMMTLSPESERYQIAWNNRLAQPVFWQKLIHTGAIWVVRVWLQFVQVQLPQINSLIPHPKYKSLCDWSTQNMPYVLFMCCLCAVST